MIADNPHAGVTDAKGKAELPNLPPGTYTVTANFAPTDTLNYNSLVDAPAGSFVIIQATPTLALMKTAAPSTFVRVGDVISYTYVLSNTGIAPLTGPFTITDDKIAIVTCPTTASLAGGASITCSATYAVTADDLRAAAARHPISRLLDTVKHLLATGPLPFQKARALYSSG